MEERWLSTAEFADVADITRRSATRIIMGAARSVPWRGHTLEVRRTFGRGGRSGLSYEVSLRSLSAALEEPLSDAPEPYAPTPSRTWRYNASADQRACMAKRLAVIEEAVQHAPGSAERAAEIAEAVKRGTPLSTVKRWIRLYEAHGAFGLARKRPTDAGAARIVVSEPFDRAFREAGHPERVLAQLGAMMEQRRRDVWASPAQRAGVNEVARRLEHELWKFCGELGVKVPEAAMRLSRRYAEQDRHFSHVDVWKHDAKRFADGAPHIVRDLTKGPPMLSVVADVKHLDLVLRREDGSEAWPKIIAFQDRTTQRVFAYPILLPVGEGVRREHVIQAFICLVSDRTWGFPQGLHLDNGTEFSCFEMIKGAFALVNEEARKEIVYSIPYNARAKTIEGWFARADRYLFSMFPGYAGRERMNKKTHKAGRPTHPYPHSWSRFCEEVLGGVAYINSRPIGGQWGGRSADQIFAEKVAALNWRPVLVDPLILDAAFCRREVLRVDRGALRWKGVRHSHELLHGIASRTELDVAISWRRGEPLLFRHPESGWRYATADQRFEGDHIEGARESGRRKRRHVKGARQLAAQVVDYDPIAASLEIAGRRKPKALPQSPDRLAGSGELIDMAASKLLAERELAALPSEDEAARRAREAEDAYLERKYGHAL